MAELSHEEQKDRDDKERFDAVFMHWPAFIAYLHGPDHIYKLANPYYLKLIGHRDIIGRPVREALPELVGQGFYELLDQVFQSGKPYVGNEMPVMLATNGDGKLEEVFINFVYQPILKEGGTDVDGILVHAIDVTEHVHARKKVEESEHRLSQALEAGAMGTWDFDIATNTAVRSVRYDQIFGYDKEVADWSSQTFWEHIIPEDKVMAEEKRAEARKTGKLDMQVRITRVDGSIRWVDVKGQMVYNKDMTPVRMIGTLVDITERKKIEEDALKASAIIDLSDDAIISKDLDGIITSWNTGAERLYGYTADEAIGKPIGMLMPPDKHDEFPKVLTKIKKGKRVDHYETLRMTKDGRILNVSITVSPIKDSYGKIIGVSKIARDITGRIQSEKTLQYLALHDPLTDLPNRKALEERLDVALAMAKRNRGKVALMFLDIDRFKIINDTLGHHIGDVVLKEIANRLKGNLRAEDTPSRLGGDEFIIMLTDISNATDVVNVAEKILKALEAPITVGESIIHITGSVGISLFPEDGTDALKLLRNADIAGYRAKESGRNRYQLYNQTMNAEATERFALGNDLRHAIANEELEVYYQPIVDARANKVAAVEALLRWHHPKLGMVYPNEFIPIAEELGLIFNVGKWVLEEVCKQHRFWIDAGHPPMRMAVNLSPLQFSEAQLVPIIADILKETHMDPEFLELEITESAAMENADRTRMKLIQLKKMGINITMDDFGTGYSSLSYLRRFPLDSLKIDKSFVKKGFVNSQDSKIIRAIVAMAHNMNLRVCAEGVETVEQLHFLKSLRCYRMQGFHFSKALPADKFIEWSKSFIRHKRFS